MATVLDVISEALKRMNSYAPGEVLQLPDANDGLVIFNDLLDSLSNEHLACYQRVENVLQLQGGKGIYTIGNPIGGTLVGVLTGGSNVITGVTAMPGNIVVGGDLIGAGIPAGTTVAAIGANTVTMSANATGSFPQETISFTTPGDFKVPRPLRISNAYTRLTSSGYSAVDYPMEPVSIDQYSSIGLKSQPGPWPKIVYYDMSIPLGTLYFWPIPSQPGELHLWTDVLLADAMTLNTVITLPQGYIRFLKIALCREMWTIYRAAMPFPALLEQLYREAKTAVKNLNAQAQSVAQYDRAIAGKAKNDAGWILHGGFN
jgi:hypothetical protein